ncbi:metalloregulator ArsR/SmtB family transcription factor [Lelliottia sp. RWM.1]|uniref:metalloregulator ArsR/SmtB family transcription factor n=1 Tax=Lelliottia sp. RWM.1 TaxID=2663242 RepID=UPI00193E94C4|nr:metalloregulator ArsR/SmtB family transcription factor [Lelliottia sp. RWM.1]MBM3071921.1 metalloregulator ArsR/SmtB family transcription factor [Lelliottia sp. RWM.1]
MQPVQLFKLLADETRTTIILLLREAGELCVCELCAITGQSQPKISRHIALLRDAGLVLDRREGKWIYYRLSPHMPAWAASVIDSAWSSHRNEVRASLKNVSAETCC